MYWSGGIFKSILTASEWWTIQQQFHCHVLCWLLSLKALISIYKFSRLNSIHFPYRIGQENLIKDRQSIFPLVIILLNLKTFSLGYVLISVVRKCTDIMLGENCMMEKMGILGLKGQIAVYIITCRWRNSNCRSISSTTIELNIPIWNHSFKKKRIKKKH